MTPFARPAVILGIAAQVPDAFTAATLKKGAARGAGLDHARLQLGK